VRDYQSSTNGTSDRKRLKHNQIADVEVRLTRNDSEPLTDIPRQAFDDNDTASSKVSRA